MFGCRGGGCGTCKMRLTSGQVEHGRCSAAVLPEAEKQCGWFLSCQARALGDLTIELSAANRYRVLPSWRKLSFPGP
jgi:ferredoxin